MEKSGLFVGNNEAMLRKCSAMGCIIKKVRNLQNFSYVIILKHSAWKKVRNALMQVLLAGIIVWLRREHGEYTDIVAG